MNTSPARAWNNRPRPRPRALWLPLLLPLALAGCFQDTASYSIGGDRQHAILLIRDQTWFWEDTVRLTIAPARLPDCQGGLTIEAVPRDEEIRLYQAPDEYAEPLYLLKTGKRLYAVSTASCRVQFFKQAPAELGELLGTFRERDGVFGFEAARAANAKP